MKILTLDEIRQKAPAAFATKPNPKVSRRYGFISTVETLKAYESQGWFPVSARQSHTRVLNNQPYTRHEITFARPEDKPIQKLGDVSPRIRLVNSHGTESTWNNVAELRRMICSNGLIVSMGSSFDYRVRHTINAVQHISDVICKLSNAFPAMLAKAEQWSQIRLGDGKILALGAAALRIRYGQDETKWPTQPEHIALTVRRQQDIGNDLWSVFNRVQENITRNGSVPTNKVNNRRRVIRTIKSIDADLSINQKLWEAADQLALSA